MHQYFLRKAPFRSSWYFFDWKHFNISDLFEKYSFMIWIFGFATISLQKKPKTIETVLGMIVNRVPKGKNYPVCVLLTQSVRYLGFWLAQHSTYTIVKTYTHSFFPHSMAFGHVYLRKYSIWISLRFFSFQKRESY